MINRLRDSRCWIFDLDGTLTLPVHDFGYIRRELAVPDGSDILGHLAALPESAAISARQRLDEIELELAARAEAAPGAVPLLERLAGLEVCLGILTRNSREIALLTLQSIGVAGLFPVEHVLGRDEALPKPEPDGILHLLDLWCGRGDSAVMVGDYLFDLQAGRAAGALTVHVGRPDGQRWPAATDITVTTLAELLELL